MRHSMKLAKRRAMVGSRDGDCTQKLWTSCCIRRETIAARIKIRSDLSNSQRALDKRLMSSIGSSYGSKIIGSGGACGSVIGQFHGSGLVKYRSDSKIPFQYSYFAEPESS